MKQQVKINRSEILSLAWTIRRQNSGMTWSECQSAAWKSFRLRSALHAGIVNFTYIKENGEVRYATGTLNADHFNYENKGTVRAENPMVIKYFDIDASAFRSCRIDRLAA